MAPSGVRSEALSGHDGPLRTSDFDFVARRFLGELRSRDKADGGSRPVRVDGRMGETWRAFWGLQNFISKSEQNQTSRLLLLLLLFFSVNRGRDPSRVGFVRERRGTMHLLQTRYAAPCLCSGVNMLDGVRRLYSMHLTGGLWLVRPSDGRDVSSLVSQHVCFFYAQRACHYCFTLCSI